MLASDPKNLSGSLGIAISEAVEVAVKDPQTRYALGSVLNHVLMHQTIIGEEALLQMEKAGDTPTLIVELHWWRFQLRWTCLPIPTRKDGWQNQSTHLGCRARIMSITYSWHLRLRLW